MVVHLIPKNRLIPRVSGLRVFQTKTNSKWATPKWTADIYTCGNGGSARLSSTHNTSNVPSNKGMRKRWRWRTVLSVLDWWCLAAGGWITWRGVLTRWTPLGVCLIAAMQWHSHRGGKSREQKIASAFEVQCYTSLPLRLFSRCFGWVADCRIPSALRPLAYGMYSTTFGVNISEAAVEDLKHYRSLAEFFSRALKPDVRPIDPVSCLVSPCDGRVLHCGPADSSHIEQVKGVSYSLEGFLGPLTWKECPQRLNPKNVSSNSDSQEFPPYHRAVLHTGEETALFQCVIYLAPGDYHRFHSPAVWTPKLRRHFPGELLSVNPAIAKWVPGLFCINERATYVGSWQHGFFSFTAVGATNVGSVKVYLDEDLSTNRWHGWKYALGHWRSIKTSLPAELQCKEVYLSGDTVLQKGEMLGHFNMGSTIVLIFEAPRNFSFCIKPGQRIKMGQRLGWLGKHVESITQEDSSKREGHSI